MELNSLIAECTAYDFKVMLEEKKPKSWLKSVSAFSNGLGGSLFFGIDVGDGHIEKCGSGLTRICNENKAWNGYKEELKPVFKSTPTQFQTIIYATADTRMLETMTETCRRRNSLSGSEKSSPSLKSLRQSPANKCRKLCR